MDPLLSGTTLNAKQALKLLPSWSLLETRKKAKIIYKQLTIYYVKCYPYNNNLHVVHPKRNQLMQRDFSASQEQRGINFPAPLPTVVVKVNFKLKRLIMTQR